MNFLQSLSKVKSVNNHTYGSHDLPRFGLRKNARKMSLRIDLSSVFVLKWSWMRKKWVIIKECAANENHALSKWVGAYEEKPDKVRILDPEDWWVSYFRGFPAIDSSDTLWSLWPWNNSSTLKRGFSSSRYLSKSCFAREISPCSIRRFLVENNFSCRLGRKEI